MKHLASMKIVCLQLFTILSHFTAPAQVISASTVLVNVYLIEQVNDKDLIGFSEKHALTLDDLEQ